MRFGSPAFSSPPLADLPFLSLSLPPPFFFLFSTRVKRLYRRQLSVPLVGNDGAVEGAKEAFSGDDAGFEEACRAHAKASSMVRAGSILM